MTQADYKDSSGVDRHQLQKDAGQEAEFGEKWKRNCEYNKNGGTGLSRIPASNGNGPLAHFRFTANS